MKCSIKNKDNKIEILIDGVPHLSFNRKKLVGFQSWIIGEEHQIYYIEFYFKNREILTEYDNKDKWEQILGLLSKENLYFDNF